jgi:hypothetical protein
MVLYFIKGSLEGSKRTRGIRIEATKLSVIGLSFYITGGFEYQRCLGNILRDRVSYLKKKEVS